MKLSSAVGYGLLQGEELANIDWTNVESQRSLGYNGLSARNVRRKAKKARDKAVIDAKVRTR